MVLLSLIRCTYNEIKSPRYICVLVVMPFPYKARIHDQVSVSAIARTTSGGKSPSDGNSIANSKFFASYKASKLFRQFQGTVGHRSRVALLSQCWIKVCHAIMTLGASRESGQLTTTIACT